MTGFIEFLDLNPGLAVSYIRLTHGFEVWVEGMEGH
jgi:hypothetical protein